MSSLPPSAGPARSTSIWPDLLVGCVLMTAVVASRHASIGCTSELSADESELLVQVRKYSHDIVPWRSVDGSTIGPLNPWFLMLARAAGWPMSYAGLHLLGPLVLGAIVFVSVATVRLLRPLAETAWIAVAAAIAIAATSTVDYMYFATELLPALALAVAVGALIWSYQKRTGSFAALVLAAGLAGLAPWAKLQSLPIAITVLGFAGWITWQEGTASTVPARPGVRLGILAACFGFPAVGMLALVVHGGVYPDFVASYVVANLGYAAEFGLSEAWVRLGRLLGRSQLNGLFAALGIVVAAGAWVAWHRREARFKTGVFPALLALAYLGAAMFACIRPPHEFEHYHLFLAGPLIVALGATSGLLPSLRESRRGWLVIAAVLLATSVLSAGHYRAGAPLRGHLAMLKREPETRLPAIVSREIRRIAPRARTMVVWGWMPTFFVQTGLESAARQTIGHFLIDPGPSRDFIRQQFMRDIRAAPPDVVVDAVATGCFTWHWKIESSGLESFPELAAYVKANYALALNVMPDAAGTPLRVFVRRAPEASR